MTHRAQLVSDFSVRWRASSGVLLSLSTDVRSLDGIRRYLGDRTGALQIQQSYANGYFLPPYYIATEVASVTSGRTGGVP